MSRSYAELSLSIFVGGEQQLVERKMQSATVLLEPEGQHRQARSVECARQITPTTPRKAAVTTDLMS